MLQFDRVERISLELMNLLEEQRVKEATRLLHSTDCKIKDEKITGNQLNPRNVLLKRLGNILKSCGADDKEREELRNKELTEKNISSLSNLLYRRPNRKAHFVRTDL